MRREFHIVGLVLVVGAVAGSWSLLTHQTTHGTAASVPQALSIDTQEAIPGTELLARIEISNIKGAGDTERALPADLHPFPELPRSRRGMSLEDDPFGASSVAEQKWLDRNGYPNQEQWAVYSRTSDTLLSKAAETGDRIARTILDLRRLESGDLSAQEDLLAAAVGGSGFALDMYASFMAGSRSGNEKTAYIISRVAEMRGDHRQVVSREFVRVRPTQQQRLEWGMEANALFNNLNKLHSKVYGDSKSWIDSRPVGK